MLVLLAIGRCMGNCAIRGCLFTGLVLFSTSHAISKRAEQRHPSQQAENAVGEHNLGGANTPLSQFPSFWFPQPPPSQIIQVSSEPKSTGGAQCTKGENWREVFAFRWCIFWSYVTPEQMTALFTVVLGLSTIGLWLATMRLSRMAEKQAIDMKASIAVAKESADAAKKSAKVAEDALTVLEKPYVFIDRKVKLIKSLQEIKDFKASNAEFVCHIAVEYFIINHGRTPAIIKNLTTTLLIVDDIPNSRRITGTPEIPPAIAMAQGVPDGPLMCLSNDAASVEICDDILSGSKFLFFYGQVSYRDVFSYEYLTGFGWRYFAKAGVWNPAGGDEYNFHLNVSPEPMKQAPFRF
jgi:hypothetical protein